MWIRQFDGSYALYTAESVRKGESVAVARLVGSRWVCTDPDGKCVSYRTLAELRTAMGGQDRC